MSSGGVGSGSAAYGVPAPTLPQLQGSGAGSGAGDGAAGSGRGEGGAGAASVAPWAAAGAPVPTTPPEAFASSGGSGTVSGGAKSEPAADSGAAKPEPGLAAQPTTPLMPPPGAGSGGGTGAAGSGGAGEGQRPCLKRPAPPPEQPRWHHFIVEQRARWEMPSPASVMHLRSSIQRTQAALGALDSAVVAAVGAAPQNVACRAELAWAAEAMGDWLEDLATFHTFPFSSVFVFMVKPYLSGSQP